LAVLIDGENIDAALAAIDVGQGTPAKRTRLELI
jgi:hypothetical protein